MGMLPYCFRILHDIRAGTERPFFPLDIEMSMLLVKTQNNVDEGR